MSSPTVNLKAVASADLEQDDGIPNGSVLRGYAVAVLGGGDAAITSARSAVAAALDENAVGDAACVIAFFNAINRVADATGTEMDANVGAGASVLLQGLGVERLGATRAAQLGDAS